MEFFVDEIERQKCPKCGQWAEWDGSEIGSKITFCDTYEEFYKCNNCGTGYSVVFDVKYREHITD